MSPLSAVALVVLGVCLWRLAEAGETSTKTRDVVGLLLAGAAAGFGLLEVTGYLLGGTVGAVFSVPPNTAFCLTCCGLALILCTLDRKRCLRTAHYMVLVVGL